MFAAGQSTLAIDLLLIPIRSWIIIPYMVIIVVLPLDNLDRTDAVACIDKGQ